MTYAGLGLEIDRERHDGAVVVHARGDLDLETAASLIGPLDTDIRAPHSRVLLDLADVSFCDSTALRALMGVAQEARVHRTRLVIVVPPGTGVARLVELTGAAEFLPMVDDREAGLRALNCA